MYILLQCIYIYLYVYLLSLFSPLTSKAGFVLHSTGPTHSTCGCQSNTQETCAFLSYSLAPNATDPNFDPISTRFLSANSCLILDPPSSCLGAEWDYNYNYVSDVCSSYASCGGETDGFVPQPVQCKCSDSSQCQVGQTSQTPPTGTPPTVTVWYNNQVRLVWCACFNCKVLSDTLNVHNSNSITCTCHSTCTCTVL